MTDVRKEFEAWAWKIHFDVSRSKDFRNSYSESNTQSAWIGYKSAAESRDARIAELEAKLARVEALREEWTEAGAPMLSKEYAADFIHKALRGEE